MFLEKPALFVTRGLVLLHPRQHHLPLITCKVLGQVILPLNSFTP